MITPASQGAEQRAIGAYIGGTIADDKGYLLPMSIYGGMALWSILPLPGVKGTKD